MIFLRKYLDLEGNRVEVFRATGEVVPRTGDVVVFPVATALRDECMYCAEGRCELELHRSTAWERDMFVHDRPGVTH